MTIPENVSILPKMSPLPPRIPRDQAARLPWPAILALFSLQHIRELERRLDLPIGTITRAWATSPAARGLSAKVHLALLKGIASQFSSSQEFRGWMRKHWPVEWLEKSAPIMDVLYAELDLTHQSPRFGAFPADYLPRGEESELLGWLINDKQVLGIWITGPGGTGKSTLALSLVRRHRAELSRRFDHLLWVDGEQGSYEQGLRQVAEQLQLAETGNLEDALRRKASRSRFLVFLDTLHNPVELARWRQLVGTLGKLVVTSRTRLSEPELRADDVLRQVRLGGFSLSQSRAFLGLTDPAVDRLHTKTDGLPLALRILSGLLHELGCSVAELDHLLESQAFETLAYPPEVAAVLGNSQNENAQYLLAGIFADLGEHAQALATLQAIQENYQRNSTSRFAQTYLLVEMADRQRDLGQWDDAIRLYEAAFAEAQSPPYIRAEYGHSLVACLRERQEFERMDQVLETVAGLLEDNPAELFQNSLIRAWHTHAETRQALGDREGALTFAHKALTLAGQISDDDQRESLQRLLEQLN